MLLQIILFPPDFCLDNFRLVSPFLTFRVSFYEIGKFSEIIKFPSKLKPCVNKVDIGEYVTTNRK